MQVCPRCKNEFPDDLEKCPNDDATLLPPEGLFSFQTMPMSQNGASAPPRQPRPAPAPQTAVPAETPINPSPRRRQRLRQPIDPRIPAAIAAGLLLIGLAVVDSRRHPASPSDSQVLPINPVLTAKNLPFDSMPAASVTEIHPDASVPPPSIRVGTPEKKPVPVTRRVTNPITHHIPVTMYTPRVPILPIPIASHPITNTIAPMHISKITPMPVMTKPRVHVTYRLVASPSTTKHNSDSRPLVMPVIPIQTPQQDSSAQVAQTVTSPHVTVPTPPTPAVVTQPTEPVKEVRQPTSNAIPFSVGHGIGSEWGPRHIVYVLDISASMPSRIDRAKRELGKALQSLGSEESFDIIAFDAQTQRLSDGLLAATPETLDLANRFLDSLQLGPGTNLEAALTQALAIPEVNDVVVVTDGVPTVGEGNFTKLARLVRQRNTSHARIYTVGLVGKNPDGTDDSFEAKQLLDQIARESGGESHIIPLGTVSP